jgi:hypothetical protein
MSQANVRYWHLTTNRGIAANVRSYSNSDQKSGHSYIRSGRSLMVVFWSLTGAKRTLP